MKINKCVACGEKISERDCIGLNKKILGRNINNFYCIECLAEYLGTNVEDLLEKVEEFKEQGCTLFM